MATSITIVQNNPSVTDPCAENCMTFVPEGEPLPPFPPPDGYAFVYAYGKKVYMPDGVTPVLVPIEFINT